MRRKQYVFVVLDQIC